MPSSTKHFSTLSIVATIILVLTGLGNCQDSSEVTRIGVYSERLFNANGVAVNGEQLYFTDHDSGFKVLDITDPSSPQLVSGVKTSGWSIDLAIKGDYCYVADGFGGLRTFDISTPSQPLETSWIPTSDWAYDISITGDRLYLADGDSGVILFDITTPSTPVALGKYPTTGWAWGITAVDSLCYVADFNNCMVILNFADPANPVELGSFQHDGRAMGVTVTGNLAIVADDTEGLLILDVSDPANPVLIKQYLTAGQALDVALLEEGFCVVADGWMGIRVINISDPANPSEVGFYNTDGVATKVVADDRFVYLADKMNVGIYDCSSALSIQDPPIDFGIPQTISIEPLYPNPFNPTVTIRYNVAVNSVVNLDIIDISGAVVDHYSLGERAIGGHTFHWDATDYPAGNYLVRLTTPEQTVTQKAVLVK